MEECFFGNVFLCFLPAHTSHGLQPADNGHFNVLKAAYRKELDRLDSITDSAPVGKINFLRCLVKARAAVKPSTIRSAWRHTRNWPISRQKALNHPDCKLDVEKRKAEAEPDTGDDPEVTRDYILKLAENTNPAQRWRARHVANTFEAMQAKIAFLEQEVAEHKAREAAQVGTKKRHAIPNPNRRFMTIHDILSKGGSIEDLENDPQINEEENLEEEEWEGFSDENEPEESIEVAPPEEIVTRSGRQINRPSK